MVECPVSRPGTTPGTCRPGGSRKAAVSPFNDHRIPGLVVSLNAARFSQVRTTVLGLGFPAPRVPPPAPRSLSSRPPVSPPLGYYCLRVPPLLSSLENPCSGLGERLKRAFF